MTWEAIKALLTTKNAAECLNLFEDEDFRQSKPRDLLRAVQFLRRKERYEECQQVIRVLKATPLSEDWRERALFAEGDVLHDMELFEACLEPYGAILARQPNDMAYNNRALALWELKRFSDAYEDYVAAANLNPENVTALRGAGEMSLKLFWYEQAEAFFGRAVALKDDYIAAWIGLGLSRFHLGDLDRAEENFRTALSLDPINEMAARGIDECQRRRG